MQKTNLKKGFTLIELLVVIGMISILSGVVYANLSSAKVKSRDAKKVSELKDLEQAVELYFQEKFMFPASAGPNGIDNLSSYYNTEDWQIINNNGVSGDFIYAISSDSKHYCLGAKTEVLSKSAVCHSTISINPAYKYRFSGPEN